MINPKKIEQIARQIHEAIPKSFFDVRCGVEKKIRKIIHNYLISLDLINREEFETQIEICARMQKKVSILEKRIEDIEKEIAEKDHEKKNI